MGEKSCVRDAPKAMNTRAMTQSAARRMDLFPKRIDSQYRRRCFLPKMEFLES
jgi:hypothetical protein